MNPRIIVIVGYSIISIALLTNLIFLILYVGFHIPSIFFLFFAIFFYSWVLSPYLVIGFFLKKHSTFIVKVIIDLIVLVTISGIGLQQILKFINTPTDPQKAIAILYFPIRQYFVLIILLIVNSIIDGIYNRKERLRGQPLTQDRK